jgi:hypothetical protein
MILLLHLSLQGLLRERSIFSEVTVPFSRSKKKVYVHVSYYERFPRQSYFTVQFQNC